MTNDGSPVHTVVRLASRSSLELDISAFYHDNEFSLFPHVEERGFVFLNFRKGKVMLSAGAFVGLIPLTPTLSVEIVPKLPVTNLGRIFETARGSLGQLRNVDRAYAVTSAGEGVLEFVISNLIDAVQDIQNEGYSKQYTRRSHQFSHPKGRLLHRETLNNCARRGKIHSVIAESFVQTADTLANRIIKAALKRALLLIRADTAPSTKLLSETARIFMTMPDEIADLKDTDYFPNDDLVSIEKSIEGRYKRCISLAVMLLGGRGISLDHSGDDQSLSSYILNLEEIFEAYLRRSLQPRMLPGFGALDGNREARKPLYTGNMQGPFAQPDMVVLEAGSPKAIAEVKYKTKLDRADINQAVTYAVAYGVEQTILVHAAPKPGKSGPYVIGHVGNVEVSGFAFDLSSDELEREEQSLANYLCRQIPAVPLSQPANSAAP